MTTTVQKPLPGPEREVLTAPDLGGQDLTFSSEKSANTPGGLSMFTKYLLFILMQSEFVPCICVFFFFLRRFPIGPITPSCTAAY